jgi:hypothetical protein
MTLHVPRLPLSLDPLMAEAKRRARRRRFLAGLGTLIGLGLALLGSILALGSRSPHDPGSVGGPPANAPNPRDITSQNASQTVVRGRLSVDGVTWVASTYESLRGRCLEVATRVGSVDGCGSKGAFTAGIGGLQVGDAWYAVAHGLAPPAAASARVELEDGSKVRSSQTYVGNGVWFAVYPATPTARADDVSKVELLDQNGNVVRSATPPSVSAYVRSAREHMRHGR